MKKLRIYRTIFAVTIAAAVGMVSCGHGNRQNEEQDHKHDEVLYLTAYGERYEIFAEADPLCIGKKSHVITHITLLDNFKPMGEGKVTATLSVGGKNVSQTIDKTHNPGIYEFSLTPPATGNATLTLHIESPAGNATQTITGLTVYDDEHEAYHAAAEAEPHVSNGAAFSKEMSWKIDFSTDEATLRPFGDIIDVTGRIEPSAGDVQTIVARASGTVHFAQPSLTVGGAVSSGETLFRVNPEVMADGSLKVRLRQAESDFKAARDAYQRGLKLKEEGLAAEAEILQLRNAYETAEANYRHLSGNFSGGNTASASPMAGFITSVDVVNGQYVEAGQPLATVARNRDLFVKADVPVRYIKRLSGIASATLRPMNSDEYVEVTADGGGIVSVGKGVTEGTQMVPVTFRLPKRASLIPGEFVDMRIRTYGGDEALTVPSDALIEQQGAWFVYVQVHPAYFEKRSVRPGRSDGLYTEILSGIKEGERVVGKGAVMVKLAQASGALDAHAGHVH